MIEMRGVRFVYEDMEMQFDLTLKRGDIAAIIGPSGAGKSTLLSLIAGFETPLLGCVCLDGRNVTAEAPARRPVTILFQDSNLFAHLDIRTNIALGIRPSARLSTAEDMLVCDALKRIGLAELGHRLPGQISGGERQRAALARALVMRRPILLLDEPFAALGPALRADMMRLVLDLAHEHNLTVLMVTHQPEDALRLNGQILFIDRGKIEWIGTGSSLLMPDLPAALGNYLGADWTLARA